MKTVVLLVSMGGPDSLRAVKPFLFNLFNDPAIIRLPSFLRYPLARLIAGRRTPTAQEIYARMGGRSPLLDNTIQQAQALGEELALLEDGYHCVVGMSYAPPFIDAAVQSALAHAPDRLVVVPLYPQYSTCTTASVMKAVTQSLSQRSSKLKPEWIEGFATEKGFIEALCENTMEEHHKARRKGPVRLLFSAHGLPLSIVKDGDPYPFYCHQTATAVLDHLGKRDADWVLCFQSRVGPSKWIGPATDEEIIKAAREKKAIVIIPISFVSEHAETIVELDMDYRALAQSNGAVYYGVVKTVAAHPAFIKGLAQKIHKN